MANRSSRSVVGSAPAAYAPRPNSGMAPKHVADSATRRKPSVRLTGRGAWGQRALTAARPPLLHFAFDVRGGRLCASPTRPRHLPHHFELVAVGVLRVQAQAGAMVVHADQRVRLDQRVAHLASSGSVSTSQARWYRPTRSPRVGSGASGPMLNSPRSWLLSVLALVRRK